MTAAAGVPAEFVAPMREQPFWPAFEAVAHTIVYDGALVGDTMSGSPLPLKRWAAIAVPTLVVDGRTSPASLHHGARALADILPNARRRTLDGQDHAVAPEVLAPVLAEFFAG